MPDRHWSRGLNWIVVSNISSGAGSGGLGAAGLAEHAFDLGHGLDQAVGLLEQLLALAAERPGSAEGM
jgi:hypothetical protein